MLFFFKQKTEYDMRISDWSSDVCSSDLGDRYWRQRDVIDDAPIFFGHDGKRQFVGGTQGAHDELLGVAGVWCISERGDGHGLDGGNVVRGFVSELEGHGLVFDCFLKI